MFEICPFFPAAKLVSFLVSHFTTKNLASSPEDENDQIDSHPACRAALPTLQAKPGRPSSVEGDKLNEIEPLGVATPRALSQRIGDKKRKKEVRYTGDKGAINLLNYLIF